LRGRLTHSPATILTLSYSSVLSSLKASGLIENPIDARMPTWPRTSPTFHKPPTAAGLIGLFGLFAGVCAAFALVFTIADACREHVQQGWPSATATIERDSVEEYRTFKSSGGNLVWYIKCRIRYVAGGEEVRTAIRSRSVNSQSNAGLLQQWIAQHEPGTTMLIHYDPGERKVAVLTETDMPYGGPRTPDNLKLLLIFSGACMVLLTIARMLRGRRAGAD
jgi:hypothetical protein